MILVPLEHVVPGMRLGRSIIDPRGVVLLKAGQTVSQALIIQLRALGFTSVYISESPEEVAIPEIVSQETRAAVVRSVDTVVRRVVAKADLRSDLVVESVRTLLDEILSQPDVIIRLVDIKALVDHTFSHSVNVAVLCLVVGRVLALPRSELAELGAGALLHDLGKSLVPPRVLEKKEALTKAEAGMIREHPSIAFEVIRKSQLGLTAAHIAYQHQERWDGSGYPRGLRGAEAIRLARLCSVCDVFDALTSERPYRPATSHGETMAYLHQQSGVTFDPEMVRALLSVVAPYPIATLVQLNTGDYAVVKDINPKDVSRPDVRVIKNPGKQFYQSFEDVKLSERNDLEIVRAASWYEVQSPR